MSTSPISLIFDFLPRLGGGGPWACTDFWPSVDSLWPGTLGIAFVSLSSILAILLSKLAIFQDPLRDIPGPFLARWTPLWLAWQVRMGRRYISVDELHRVRDSRIFLFAAGDA